MSEKVLNTVYEARERLGMTQEELARKVGITRQTIIAIEKGNYAPSILLALKISRFFKKPLEEIFSLK
ncbi:MAG TPA: helix-turn-helix transcriptional regulator [Candidatus Paceibacterota bacterium]|nr:helix-turn-helix transcriptional regulator [Candidatus Paceibacterota bacterium]